MSLPIEFASFIGFDGFSRRGLERNGENRRVAPPALRTAVVALLAVEVLDELVFGAREAAWPLIRRDVDLSYAEVGLLLSIPAYVSTVAEPAIGLLGDTRLRRAVVAAGGLAFALALVAAALSDSFWPLLAAFVVLFAASGAFVSLSQANLMDLEPEARDRNMARWSVAGGLGAVAGPLAVAAVAGWSGGWRWLFAAFAVATLSLLLVTMHSWPAGLHPQAARPSLRKALAGLRRPTVVRWLVILEFANLMTDVLLGFLALYFVDEVSASAEAAGLAVAVWTGAGLAGGLAIVVLLRRTSGVAYLRASAPLVLVLYAGLLTLPGTPAKLVLVGALGLATAGWYSIPKARLYATLPGQSGAALTLGSLAGVIRAAAPLAIGLAADRYSLGSAMWLLVVAPIGLLVLVPRRQSA
jgi:MFS transporter, FSR family, fosmidomycin resistance protein